MFSAGMWTRKCGSKVTPFPWPRRHLVALPGFEICKVTQSLECGSAAGQPGSGSLLHHEKLCNLGQVAQPLCALVSSSVKWKSHACTYLMAHQEDRMPGSTWTQHRPQHAAAEVTARQGLT